MASVALDALAMETGGELVGGFGFAGQVGCR